MVVSPVLKRVEGDYAKSTFSYMISSVSLTWPEVRELRPESFHFFGQHSCRLTRVDCDPAAVVPHHASTPHFPGPPGSPPPPNVPLAPSRGTPSHGVPPSDPLRYFDCPAIWPMRKMTNSAGFTGAMPISQTICPASTTSGGLVSESHFT